MLALQYVEPGRPPELREVPRPEPGPGQALVRVAAAGACHSDLTVLSAPPETYRLGPLPLTLGHEAAGTVAALGPGATGVTEGEEVVVYGAWGCGRCRRCARGEENYCTRAAELGIRPPGIGSPGAMAEYLLVDATRHLVPTGGLSATAAVALADAALTPYHAIRRAEGALRPGSAALVVGVGGLGHVAVQLLRALTGVHVVAVDIAPDKLDLARECAAHTTALADSAESVRDALGGVEVGVILDFVGSASTTALATDLAGVGGEILVVGVGEGSVPVGFRRTAHDVGARFTLWGSLPELYDVVELARSGLVEVRTTTYSMQEAPAAYRDLAGGTLLGRAVVEP